MRINIQVPFVSPFKINNSLCSGILLFLLSALSQAAHQSMDLSQKIHQIEKKTNTVMGMEAIYIENGKTIAHNSSKPFFMASTIKLPIAVAFLHRVDENKESLERKLKLDAKNSVPGSGSLYYLFERKSMSISMRQILKYTLIHSDNSASDALLNAVNGPDYVNKRMNDLGFKNIHVNRSILEMFLDTNHVDHAYLKQRLPVASLKQKFNGVPLEQKKMAWMRFQKDMRDTTTAHEMASLLVKVYKKEALSEASTKVLLDIMEACVTGRSRIKGLLPWNVKVAHKTGTWAINEYEYLKYPGSKELYRFASDVGIITLPHNKGHIAIAVYVKSKAASDYSRARAIALTSRAVYDHFMALTTNKTMVLVKKEKQKRPIFSRNNVARKE